eukprot:Rhum_TRINITY_DN12581_c1_g1::Rhum_TRINITY_DN12581_c1_g1_i1::g.52969::m.52969
MPAVYTPPSSRRAPLPHGEGLAGKTLLVVLTSGLHRASVYEALLQLGVTLVFVNPCKNWAECLRAEWILTEVTDIKEMCANVAAGLRSLGNLGSVATADGVLTFDEYGTYACAELGRYLGVVSTPATPEVVAKTVVKTQLRSHLLACGLNVPRCAAIRSVAELRQIEAAATIGLNFPVVVKPSMGGGGAFVTVVTSFAEMVSAVESLMKRLLNHKDAKYWTAYSTLHILVEEYIVGEEVDVDCIVQDGVLKYAAISDNKPTTAPYFREVGGVAPTQLPPCAQEAILAELERWVASHGTSVNGLLHYEARYNAATNRSYTIEVNMRLGGAESLTLNQEAWGVSLPVAAAMIALGQRVPDLTHLSRNARRSVSSINFVPETNGLLVRQEIPQTVVDDPAFAGACLYETPGSFVASPPVRFTCLGWLCAYGDDGVASEQELARLVSQVTFDITQNIDPEAPVTAAVAEAQAQTEQQFTQPPNDALTKCPVTGDSVCRCAVAA